MHKNCLKSLALNGTKAKEPAKAVDIETGIYGRYVKNQGRMHGSAGLFEEWAV
jgi:hypothetical protein